MAVEVNKHLYIDITAMDKHVKNVMLLQSTLRIKNAKKCNKLPNRLTGLKINIKLQNDVFYIYIDFIK